MLSFSCSQFSLCDCLCTHLLHIWTLQLPSLDLQGTISNAVIDWLGEWHKFSGPITEYRKANQCNPGLPLTLKCKLIFKGEWIYQYSCVTFDDLSSSWVLNIMLLKMTLFSNNSIRNNTYRVYQFLIQLIAMYHATRNTAYYRALSMLI